MFVSSSDFEIVSLIEMTFSWIIVFVLVVSLPCQESFERNVRLCLPGILQLVIFHLDVFRTIFINIFNLMCSVLAWNILFIFFSPPFLLFVYFQVFNRFFSDAHLRIRALLVASCVLPMIIVTGMSRSTLPLSWISMMWLSFISSVLLLMSVRGLLSVVVITLITILIISTMRNSVITLCLMSICWQIFLSGHSILDINTFLMCIIVCFGWIPVRFPILMIISR